MNKSSTEAAAEPESGATEGTGTPNLKDVNNTSTVVPIEDKTVSEAEATIFPKIKQIRSEGINLDVECTLKITYSSENCVEVEEPSSSVNIN